MGQINPVCVLHVAQRPPVFTFPSKPWETGVLACVPLYIHGSSYSDIQRKQETNDLNRIVTTESKPTLEKFKFSSSNVRNIATLQFSSLNHGYVLLTKMGQGVGILFHLEYCVLLLIGPKSDTKFPLSHLYLTVRFPVLIQAFVASFYLIIFLSDILDMLL